MRRVKLTISGKVNGVFFRAFIKDKASELNLKGYTKNTEDKKVEILVEGHDIMIKRLIEFCRIGPKDAKVENIQIDEQVYKNEFNTFKVK